MGEPKRVQTQIDGIETELLVVEDKKLTESRTVKTNFGVILAGWVAIILPYLVDLETILTNVAGLELTPDSVWLIGVILLVLGPLNIFLRYITESGIVPIFGKQAD